MGDTYKVNFFFIPSPVMEVRGTQIRASFFKFELKPTGKTNLSQRIYNHQLCNYANHPCADYEYHSSRNSTQKYMYI